MAIPTLVSLTNLLDQIYLFPNLGTLRRGIYGKNSNWFGIFSNYKGVFLENQ